MIDRCNFSDAVPIFIADRGFHSFNAFAYAIEHHAYFLICAKDVNMRRLLGHDIPEENCFDVWIDRILTRLQSKKKRKHPELEEQYRSICRGVTFDCIDHGSGDEYPISLRILRFNISNDTYENIITNFPASSFSAAEIRSLYGLRWGIETSFRELMHMIGAINFHSKKREYIEMEVWARLLLYNFCSIITSHVVTQKENGNTSIR